LRQKAEDELRKKTESEELLRTIKDFLQPQAAPPAPYKPLPPPSLQHGAPLDLIQPQP